MVSRIAYVRGEVDIATAPKLLEVIEFLSTIADGDVMLDLEGVTFLDAAGLGAIVECHNHMALQDHAVRVVNASLMIRRVFDLGGLGSLIQKTSTGRMIS